MRATPMFLLVLAACAESPAYEPSIETGVFGRTTSTSDVVGYPDGVYANVPVAVYANSSKVAETTSDADGRYELALVPGHYEICVLNAAPESIENQRLMNCAGKCTYFSAGAAPIELGWAANLSGGWWDGGEHCP